MENEQQKSEFNAQLSQRYGNVFKEHEISSLSFLFDVEITRMYGELDKYHKKNGNTEVYEDRKVRVNTLNHIAKKICDVLFNFRKLQKSNSLLLSQNQRLIARIKELENEINF